MSFARAHNVQAVQLSTHTQRAMERAIDERCAEHKAQALESIKKAAAPKTLINERDFEKHRAAVELQGAKHKKIKQHKDDSVRRANATLEANLLNVEARTTFELRRSVAERGAALQEASLAKRKLAKRAEIKNARKLAKLVQKAKPRTEVALPAEVLAGRAAREAEKRSKLAAEASEVAAANKAAGKRLRDVVRKHGLVDGGLAAHAAAHEERRLEMDKAAAAKRTAEARAAKANRKQLEQMSAAARPKTLVSLSADHEQKLSELTQLSQQRARAERSERRLHEKQLTALTAGSTRKLELPPLGRGKAEGGKADSGKAERPGSAERRAATLIQAARRGSVGRSDAETARRALARRRAVTPQDGSAPNLLQPLPASVALLAKAAGDASPPPPPHPRVQALRCAKDEVVDEELPARPSIGHKTVAAARSWLAEESRLQQRRPAITPSGHRAVSDAAATFVAAAAAA